MLTYIPILTLCKQHDHMVLIVSLDGTSVLYMNTTKWFPPAYIPAYTLTKWLRSLNFKVIIASVWRYNRKAYRPLNVRWRSNVLKVQYWSLNYYWVIEAFIIKLTCWHSVFLRFPVSNVPCPVASLGECGGADRTMWHHPRGDTIVKVWVLIIEDAFQQNVTAMSLAMWGKHFHCRDLQ